MADESFDEQYLLQKQLSHEFHSPGMKIYNERVTKAFQDEQEQFQNDLQKQGVEPEEAAASTEGLQEPAVDPVSAAAGGFGGVFKTALGRGAKLMPSLSRAAASGTVSAVTEYPIGIATSSVEEKYPKLALPLTVALGFLSGATIEKAIENAVSKRLGKVAQGALKKEAAAVNRKIKNGVFDETTEDAVNAINKEIGEAPLEKALGSGVPRPKTKITESKFLDLESDIKGKKYAGNINLPRIESSDDIKKSIDKMSKLFKPEFEKARRGVQSHKQTARLAESLGMTTEQLLKRNKGEAFSSEYALASRNLLVSSADNLNELAVKVQSLDATDIDKFEFRKALNTHYAIQAQVSGMTAEAGRALQSFRIPAKSSEVKVKQIKEFLDNMPGGTIDDIAGKITQMDSLQGINTFARQVQKATTTDMVLEGWINGLLSGPQTHAVNMASNSLVSIWQMPERVLASGISKMLRDDSVGFGEAFQQLRGLVEGGKDGLIAFGKTLKKSALLQPVEQGDVFSKIEANQYRAITAENIKPIINKIAPNALEEGGTAARFADYLGEAIRTPGKLLVGEDEFFKSVGYRMELRARSYRRAVTEEGLEGTPAALRMQEIMNDPQSLAPDIHLASVDAARYQTFTKQLGEGGQALQKFLNAHPAGRVIVPFVRTPTNILKFAGERTPLAWLSQNVRNEITAGGARRDLAMAKMAVGSMVMGTIASMTMEGSITGNGPSNSAMRSIKRGTGWAPYSVKVGDKYYSYNRLEPIGMLFGAAADFTEIAGNMTEDERDDLATAIVSAVSQNVTSKTWLRGLSQTLEAFNDPKRYGGKWWESLAGTAVPTGVAQVERIISPEMSAINGAIDNIKSRIPGFSDSLPPRRNMWAEVIAPEGGLGPDIISPIYTSSVKESKIDEELLRLQLPIQMPKQTQIFDGIGVKLDPKEYDRFLVLMNETPLNSTGDTLKKSLNNLVTGQDYAFERDPEIKEMRIRHLITEARFLAKDQLRNEFGIIDHIVSSERSQKGELK